MQEKRKASTLRPKHKHSAASELECVSSAVLMYWVLKGAEEDDTVEVYRCSSLTLRNWLSHAICYLRTARSATP